MDINSELYYDTQLSVVENLILEHKVDVAAEGTESIGTTNLSQRAIWDRTWTIITILEL